MSRKKLASAFVYAHKSNDLSHSIAFISNKNTTRLNQALFLSAPGSSGGEGTLSFFSGMEKKNFDTGDYL
jgi:hypothetical protein